MQVGINIKCMHTSFGGCGLSGFRDIATFQKRPNFPFGAWTIVQVIEKFNRSESAQKNHASRINIKCMHTSFGGCNLSGFRDIATFQKRPNFPFGAWTIVQVIEKFNRSESAQKNHASRINIKCMHTSFGGCNLSGFRDIATLQKRPNFPFRAWTIVHGHRKI